MLIKPAAHRLNAIAIATILLSSAATAQIVDINDVPDDVLSTARATAPGVDFHTVSIERENGVDVYEFEAEDYRGRHIEVDVREDGSLEEIEMEMELDEVPAAVRDALNAEFNDFSVSYVEASIRANGVFAYEFEGRTANGTRMDLEIAEDGEILSREQFYS